MKILFRKFLIIASLLASTLYLSCGDSKGPGIIPDLAAPTNLQAKALDSAVFLDWNPVVGAAYRIYFGTESGRYLNLGSPIEVIAHEYRMNGLTNDATYFFVITAFDETRESAYSIEATAIPKSMPILSVNAPAELQFNCNEGENSVNQGIVVENSGSGRTLLFSIETSMDEIKPNPNSGVLSSLEEVSVSMYADCTNLSSEASPYEGNILISAGEVDGSPITINFVINVDEISLDYPVISVTPEHLDLECSEGELATGSILINNVGGGESWSWHSEVTQPWLSVQNDWGYFPGTPTIVANCNGLEGGNSYGNTITLTAYNAEPKTVSVTLVVHPPSTTEQTLYAMHDGYTYASGDSANSDSSQLHIGLCYSTEGRSFMRFDLSDVDVDSLISAKLKIHQQDLWCGHYPCDHPSLSLCKLDEDYFVTNGDGLDQPDFNITFETIMNFVVDQGSEDPEVADYEIDVLSAIQSLSGDYLPLMLKMHEPGGCYRYYFTSLDNANATLAPRLDLVFN